MFHPSFYNTNPMGALDMLQQGMGAPGSASRRFDEYYRCYPLAMLPGPERENINHGGKVIMPPSALDKLTRLHITYPMLFELVNGAHDKMTHAGVLEFIAEEGKIYLPYWMMQTLLLDPGDLVQIKSTDLPPGNFIKLRPQSPAFLDITDPKAVLENAFRNFACLTRGDIFTFAYNESVYEVEVCETKPSIAAQGAIGVLETDIEVDFEPPVGYEEPQRPSAQESLGKSASSKAASGVIHTQGSMAKAINYAAIAPNAASSGANGTTASSHFATAGQKLKTSSKTKSAKVEAIEEAAISKEPVSTIKRHLMGPQPLRLPPGKLFFGYEVKPVRKEGEIKHADQGDPNRPRFQGQGQTLRKGGKRNDVESTTEPNQDLESKTQAKAINGGTGASGRTLKDSKPSLG